MQLDFGEAGEEKSFRVIDVKPGPRPAKISYVPYVGAKQLVHVSGTLAEIELRANELKDAGWLRVVVDLESADPDVERRIRNLLPNAVGVKCVTPRESAVDKVAAFDSTAPSEVFRQFFREAHGKDATAELIEIFETLREEVEEK